MGEIWTEVPNYSKKADFMDSDYNMIVDKEIDATNLPTLYLGEENCTAITFIMDRYQNGIDFASKNKKLFIAYTVNGVDMVSTVVNVATSDANRIKFSWIPNEYVGRFTGEVPFSIKFRGVNSDNTDSVWSTGNAMLHVLNVINPYVADNNALLDAYTLFANGWVKEDTDYTYTLSIVGATSRNQAIISTNCTGVAYKALRDADIYFVECGENYVKIYASGYKPTVDTSVKIVIQ